MDGEGTKGRVQWRVNEGGERVKPNTGTHLVFWHLGQCSEEGRLRVTGMEIINDPVVLGESFAESDFQCVLAEAFLKEQADDCEP